MDPPIKPSESDCCGSGCTPCVFDIYEQQLGKYNRYLNGEVTFVTRKNCISQTTYEPFILTSITNINDDTKLFTFTYKNEIDDNELYFDPGQHFLVRCEGDCSKYFTRAYTPLYKTDRLSFTILMKMYDTGRMSNYFRGLKVSDETLWRGPYGEYRVNFGLKNLLMICQGTGIAPFYSILNSLLENDDCETFIKLFYCCNVVYLHEELYRLKSYWNFTYELFLSNSGATTKYGEIVHHRRLTSDDINKYLRNIQFDGLEILLCGSNSFINTLKTVLLQCNVGEGCIFVF